MTSFILLFDKGMIESKVKIADVFRNSSLRWDVAKNKISLPLHHRPPRHTLPRIKGKDIRPASERLNCDVRLLTAVAVMSELFL